MEAYNIDTSVVIPEIYQSDAERIHEETNNSVLIHGGNNIWSSVVDALVDETPLGVGYPIDFPQECVSH